MSLENQIMVEEGLCGASGLMEKNGKTATGEIEGLMESQFVDYKHRKPDWVRLVSGGPGKELVRAGLFPHSGELWKMFSKCLLLHLVLKCKYRSTQPFQAVGRLSFCPSLVVVT